MMMNHTSQPLFSRSDFRMEPGITYVCAGGETPFLRSHDQAMLRYAHDKSQGMPGRDAQEATARRARTLAARLLHTDPSHIGFVSNVAEGVSMVAESIDWRVGDNVCFAAHEYPSVVMPFVRLKERHGIDIRLADERQPLNSLVDSRTRLIGASHVSYLNGARQDMDGLRTLADACGALLLVDYTQSAGTMPIHADLADFAFSACYKWLLGTTGVTLAFWNRARQPDWQPGTAGWYSIDVRESQPDYRTSIRLHEDARRFTRGNPAFLPVYVLANALDYLLRHDMKNVASHIAALTGQLLDGLTVLGLDITTPPTPALRGANVCFDTSDAADTVAQLEQQGILAWGGRGRVRFSFHGYNDVSDVEAIIQALRPIYG